MAHRRHAYAALMSTDPSGDEHKPRALLESLLERMRDGRPLVDLVEAGVDPAHIASQLAPMAVVDAEISSIAGTDERVDATVRVLQAEWRVVFGIGSAGRLAWLDRYERPTRYDGIAGGRAVVVNGPSGAGKSSLMSAVQALADFPVVVLDEPEHIGTVQAGYLIWRETAPSLHRGYLSAAAALARAGNHVIVSAAGHPQDEIDAAFDGIPLLAVAMSCELEVLVQRERRTGRWAGIAEASVGAHEGWTYDLHFDTTDSPDPHELAASVLAWLREP